MRKQKGFLFLALLCIMSILASCVQVSGSADPADNHEQEQETTAVKVVDKGNIIQKEGDRWLITAFVEKNGSSYIDAYWFTVSDQTELKDSGGQDVTPENMALGAQVEAWYTGAIAESYPAQTTAAKIILLDESQKVPEGMIGYTDAVQYVLESQTGQTDVKAIKSVSLDEEKEYWVMELVEHQTVDQPVTIKIDARTGQPVPAVAAENDAFRVFSPLPGTVAGSPFTVEGEARVFEAAFSWRLEDGHNILAEGHEMSDEGAPAWGRFRFDITYKKASQPNMTLILFTYSANDGSIENELIIPLKVPEDRIDYTVE
ncbi:Gmad2 immunoglobulin-like domain-containing protein [Paenibacillus alkalitolerans]|uniref:Gmad2 immunoglobulin-like domain-containing protein n=1 Tax=Paenibacillus alkalitolerans TaxID=2799335 RepID=UPI0018F5B0B2|nr:Gmad2 immunoglobulin-like domain-containing protein [Paenibacillus alkalitolerans]